MSPHFPTEKNVLEELNNIVHNDPLFAGDTLSHATANECVRRGWAERNRDSNFIPTEKGLLVHAEASK